jgi:alcohol dehydrogenase (cytochrome c)
MMKGFLKATAACALALMVAAPALADGPAAGPGDADLMADATTTGDVLTYGMGPQAHRFSPLNQINTANVAKMVPALPPRSAGKSSAARNRSRSSMTA